MSPDNMYESKEGGADVQYLYPLSISKLDGDGWSKRDLGHFNPWEDPRNPFAKEAGEAPELGWSGLENGKSLGPIGVRNPKSANCNESLYRLSYSGPYNTCNIPNEYHPDFYLHFNKPTET